VSSGCEPADLEALDDDLITERFLEKEDEKLYEKPSK
jgi:hypothetical protein